MNKMKAKSKKVRSVYLLNKVGEHGSLRPSAASLLMWLYRGLSTTLPSIYLWRIG